jgi:dihydrofolate reductase
MSTPGGKRVVLVAAIADNGVIGSGGDIPWRIPGEQQHFKAVTLGHVLLMGRATYDSIGRPLPGRTTIVLTRDPAWSAAGVRVAHSLEAALAQADSLPGDVMVAGGADVYAAALAHADEQILTEVHLSPDGDTTYPSFDRADWTETARTAHGTHDIVTLRRVPDAVRASG